MCSLFLLLKYVVPSYVKVLLQSGVQKASPSRRSGWTMIETFCTPIVYIDFHDLIEKPRPWSSLQTGLKFIVSEDFKICLSSRISCSFLLSHGSFHKTCLAIKTRYCQGHILYTVFW